MLRFNLQHVNEPFVPNKRKYKYHLLYLRKEELITENTVYKDFVNFFNNFL